VVSGRFVDISGIVDGHCLNFFFIIEVIIYHIMYVNLCDDGLYYLFLVIK
jgi:hypothetical protein